MRRFILAMMVIGLFSCKNRANQQAEPKPVAALGDEESSADNDQGAAVASQPAGEGAAGSLVDLELYYLAPPPESDLEKGLALDRRRRSDHAPARRPNSVPARQTSKSVLVKVKDLSILLESIRIREAAFLGLSADHSAIHRVDKQETLVAASLTKGPFLARKTFFDQGAPGQTRPTTASSPTLAYKTIRAEIGTSEKKIPLEVAIVDLGDFFEPQQSGGKLRPSGWQRVAVVQANQLPYYQALLEKVKIGGFEDKISTERVLRENPGLIFPFLDMATDFFESAKIIELVKVAADANVTEANIYYACDIAAKKPHEALYYMNRYRAGRVRDGFKPGLAAGVLPALMDRLNFNDVIEVATKIQHPTMQSLIAIERLETQTGNDLVAKKVLELLIESDDYELFSHLLEGLFKAYTTKLLSKKPVNKNSEYLSKAWENFNAENYEKSMEYSQQLSGSYARDGAVLGVFSKVMLKKEITREDAKRIAGFVKEKSEIRYFVISLLNHTQTRIKGHGDLKQGKVLKDSLVLVEDLDQLIRILEFGFGRPRAVSYGVPIQRTRRTQESRLRPVLLSQALTESILSILNRSAKLFRS